jgi:3-phosphoshikimate 1-carboxyvinyltransferase
MVRPHRIDLFGINPPMPLPDLIEIVPLTKPVQAEITVPGSKSITNRALILAALAQGETTLRGALWSEDTEVMTAALRDLGFQIAVEADPNEACNRTIRVQGLGGRIPKGGTSAKPLDLFVGNAGTAARFLAAMVCLGDGAYRLHGVPRMHERPQAALFAALRELGYRVDSSNDKLPATIFGTGTSRGNEAPSDQSLLTSAATIKRCRVSVAESSQFASALILAAQNGGWQIEVTGANADELPYVEMTHELVKAFPKSGGEFQIEPDASSGSYFWAAVIEQELSDTGYLSPFVTVRNWPTSGWQIDARFPKWMDYFATESTRSLFYKSEWMAEEFGADWRNNPAWLESDPHAAITTSRKNHLGDSIMTAIVVAPFAVLPVTFTDLTPLRVQECERVVALRTELTKCGARVIEEGDTLTVYPSALHGAEIETYNDHRMAMCFAVLGLKVPGIKLRNPSCVKKTFPNFFQKLATTPPHGLGATILNARTGEPLEHHDLFAV